MRKLILLAVTLAMLAMVAVPAVAQVGGGFGQSASDTGQVDIQTSVSKQGEVTPPPSPPPPPPPQAAPPPPPPPQAAPPPPPPPKMEVKTPPPPKMEEKKELPKTGGSDSAPLLGLGAGALLVGGGLLVRRLVR